MLFDSDLSSVDLGEMDWGPVSDLLVSIFSIRPIGECLLYLQNGPRTSIIVTKEDSFCLRSNGLHRFLVYSFLSAWSYTIVDSERRSERRCLERCQQSASCAHKFLVSEPVSCVLGVAPMSKPVALWNMDTLLTQVAKGLYSIPR